MNQLFFRSVYPLAMSILLAACHDTRQETTPVTHAQTDHSLPDQNADAVIGDWGVATQYLSSTVEPGDDFFTFVNEGWLESAQYPPGMPRISSFVELSLQAESDIKTIISDAALAPENNNQQLIASLYQSFMDVETLNELGLQPVKPEIDAILSAQHHRDIVMMMQEGSYTAPVNFGVNIDTNDPTRYALTFAQGGLGLPSREYYLLDEAPYPGHLEAYEVYIEDLLTMAGLNEQLPYVPAIIAFEKALAEAHWSNAEMRDPVRMTHYMSLSALSEYAPGIDWLDMMNNIGFDLNPETTIVAGTDTALAGIASLFSETPLEVIKAYMLFHLLDNQASFLGQAWTDRKFAFEGTQLQGLTEMRAREDNAVMLLNTYLGEVVGEEYVKRHFPPSYRDALMVYIDYLEEAFRERLESRDWMDDGTKEEALDKLARLNAEIGYPSQWHDYSELQLAPDTLVANINQITHWLIEDTVAKLDEPVRQWEWGNNPQEINAYYSPAQNEVVFLAAILQPPFFDPNADFAVNFGSILGVIGHEVSHGFDDQGSQYDSVGRLRNWWSAQANEAFTRKGDSLAEQYDSYEPIPGAYINGRLTLGENMADLGGVSVSFHALENYIQENYPDGAPVIDGFTAEQRFFLAWAQMWHDKGTDDVTRMLLLRDPHSPGQFRANGTVRNLDAWYEAFDIGPGADLYLAPEERISTW